MKSKLRSGMLCSCLVFLIQASRSYAQETAQSQPQPQAQGAKVIPRDTEGDAFSIEPLGWWTRNAPVLRLGMASTLSRVNADGSVTYAQTTPGNLDSLGKSKYGAGAVITFPTGSENNLQISYFRIQGESSRTLTQDMILFGNPFYNGDLFTTSYKVQDFKLSWNYLTFPHPSTGSNFRVKTLWEVQYVKINSVMDAPLDLNTAATPGNKTILLPTLGLGIEYHVGKHLLLQAKGSGFGWYKKADIWDAEAAAVIRAGRLEAFLGGKAFHFKTSPKVDQYFTETLWGPYLGLRWILR